jgi:hypothetical protein
MRQPVSENSDEIVRLLALLVRLQLPSQATAIERLNQVGFSPTRIAALLGTNPNVVNVSLAKAKAERLLPKPALHVESREVRCLDNDVPFRPPGVLLSQRRTFVRPINC